MKKIILACVILMIVSFFPLPIEAEEKEYTYRIEYYYDNVIDDSKTTYKKGKYASLIVDYETKNKKGYIFSHSTIDDEGLTIRDEEDQNVIKVYYEKDEKSQKTAIENDDIEKVDDELELRRKIRAFLDFLKKLLLGK